MVRLIITLVVGFATFTFLPGVAPVVRGIAFMGFSWLTFAVLASMGVTYKAMK